MVGRRGVIAMAGGGGVCLLWQVGEGCGCYGRWGSGVVAMVQLPLQVQVWPRIKNTQSLPTEPLNRFDVGKASYLLVPPAVISGLN